MPGGVGLLRMVAWILGIFVSGLVFFKANLGDSHTHNYADLEFSDTWIRSSFRCLSKVLEEFLATNKYSCRRP